MELTLQNLYQAPTGKKVGAKKIEPKTANAKKIEPKTADAKGLKTKQPNARATWDYAPFQAQPHWKCPDGHSLVDNDFFLKCMYVCVCVYSYRYIHVYTQINNVYYIYKHAQVNGKCVPAAASTGNEQAKKAKSAQSKFKLLAKTPVTAPKKAPKADAKQPVPKQADAKKIAPKMAKAKGTVPKKAHAAGTFPTADGSNKLFDVLTGSH